MFIVRTDARQPEIVARALARAPKLAAKFVRQEMDRGGKRIRKVIIKRRMSGPPGIRAGKKLKGSLKTEVSPRGTALEQLRMRIFGRGKIFEAHEHGATIRGRPWLYFRVTRRARVLTYGHKARTVKPGTLLRVRMVVLKPRLRFIDTAREQVPDLIARMGRAMERAIAASANPAKPPEP